MHGPYPLLPLTNCKMPTVQYQIQPHHVRETKKNEMEKWTQCELCFFARLMWSNSVNPNFDSKSLQTLLIVHVTGGIHKLFYKLIIQWSCLQDKVYQETNNYNQLVSYWSICNLWEKLLCATLFIINVKSAKVSNLQQLGIIQKCHLLYRISLSRFLVFNCHDLLLN